MATAVAPSEPRRATKPAKQGDGTVMAQPVEQPREKARMHLPLAGLLAIQLLIGYEWFISGITKIVRGGFPSGLADDLRDKSQGAAGWYVDFLNNAVIPHGRAFGYLIEWAEVLAGVAFIAGAFLWLFAWDRVPNWARLAALAVVALDALGATFLAINLHLANGSPHPWLIPGSGFDEGIDLDSLLPAMQLVLFAVNGWVLVTLWRRLRAGVRSNIEAGAQSS